MSLKGAQTGITAGHLLQLPDAPGSEHGAVKAWEQPMTMVSFLPVAG